MSDPKKTYLTRRSDDLKELNKSLDQGDFEFSLMLGHRLKGHGDTFGYLEISLLGKKLEEAAKNKDLNGAIAIAALLSNEVQTGLSQLE